LVAVYAVHHLGAGLIARLDGTWREAIVTDNSVRGPYTNIKNTLIV